MGDGVDRHLGRSVEVPLALCLLPYLFDWIQVMKQLAPSGPEQIKKRKKKKVVRNSTIDGHECFC